MKNQANQNKITVVGEIISEFTFSHKILGEGFYTVHVTVNRMSGQADVLPLMISERLINVQEDYRGCMVEAIGRLRSCNYHNGTEHRLRLSVFVREINFVDEFTNHTKNNEIFMDGYICKEPIYRKTLLGREITDILLAVNRPYGKSDYIPCIAWGRNARFASSLEIGTRICVEGRVQSREYIKKVSETEYEKRVVYEVSISALEVIDK